MIPGINTILVSVLEAKILIDSAFYKQIEDVEIND